MRWAIALAVVAVVALGTCVLNVLWQPSHHVFTIRTMAELLSWPGDPDLELNAESISKLNNEVEALIREQAPGTRTRFVIVSRGKRTVALMSASDGQEPSTLPDLVKKFVKRRMLELAHEQAGK